MPTLPEGKILSGEWFLGAQAHVKILALLDGVEMLERLMGSHFYHLYVGECSTTVVLCEMKLIKIDQILNALIKKLRTKTKPKIKS